MKRYEKILTLKVFNVEDVYNLTGNMNTAKSIIRNLLLFGYIKRVKHNLYVVCNIEFKNTIPDQYMIASKIKDDAYISFSFTTQFARLPVNRNPSSTAVPTRYRVTSPPHTKVCP